VSRTSNSNQSNSGYMNKNDFKAEGFLQKVNNSMNASLQEESNNNKTLKLSLDVENDHQDADERDTIHMSSPIKHKNNNGYNIINSK